MGLGSAVALNMLDMIGVGPFITLPLVVVAMHGPQAMLGWVLGAALAMCDGLVWRELGASMPTAGGSYEYLKQIYGPNGLGRLVSFLFIWQLTFSAPLSIASGCIGLAAYAGYLWPNLRIVLLAAQSAPGDSAARAARSGHRHHAGHVGGDGQLSVGGAAAVPAHHRAWGGCRNGCGAACCSRWRG